MCVWFPHPRLRAVDASELVAAWLAMPEIGGRLTRRERCERLLMLAGDCITPKLLPGRAPVARRDGRPLLIASHAIFPAVRSYVEASHDLGIGLALEHSEQLYDLRETLADVIGRLEALQQVVLQQGEEVAELARGLNRVNRRVEAVEQRLLVVEDRVNDMERRVQAIELFLKSDLTVAQANGLLDRFAPVLCHDNWVSGPLISPSEYADDASFLVTRDADPLVRDWLRSGGPHLSDPARFAAWLQSPSESGLDWGDRTAGLELVPRSMRRRGLGKPERGISDAEVEEMNKRAIKDRQAVYGLVAPLVGEGESLWSIKYFWFNAWNETAFPDGEGNHEGDWGCVDLTVHVPFAAGVGADFNRAEILDAIVHEHGRPHRYARKDLDIDPMTGRIRIYLEAGTNEAHSQPGEASDFRGINLDVLDVGLGNWSYPVIREHRGRGYEYDVRGAVRNLFDPDVVRQQVDMQLVRYYRGQWGEFDDDDFKSWPLIGRDSTNPSGPLENRKFRDRYGVIDHR